MRGTGVSPGIVVGKAFLGTVDKPGQGSVQSWDLSQLAEIEKYDQAVYAAMDEVRQILNSESLLLGPLERDALETQLKYLNDSRLREDVLKMIQDQHQSAIEALMIVGKNLVKVYKAIDEDFHTSHAAHVQDINNRLLRHLNCSPREDIALMTGRCILVVDTLEEGDMDGPEACEVVGIAARKADHQPSAVEAARKKGVPAIVNCGTGLDLIRNNDLIVLDGSKGLMLLNPDVSRLMEFQRLKDDNQRMSEALEDLFND